MAGQIRTNFRTILAKIRTRISAKMSWTTTEKVIPVIRADILPLSGDRDVLLKPGGFNVDQPRWDGGGRITTEKRRRLEVVCRTRFAPDIVGSADKFLLNETYGHDQFEDDVFDSLAGYIPLSGSDGLTSEPIRPLNSTDPRPMRAQKAGKVIDWGESSLWFLVSFHADVDQAVTS